MKQQVIFWKGLLVSLLVPAALFGAEGSFEKTLQVTGPVQLEVLTSSGNIEVRAGGSGAVRVSGRIKTSAGWFGGDAEGRVRALESNPPISQVGNYIRIGK